MKSTSSCRPLHLTNQLPQDRRSTSGFLLLEADAAEFEWLFVLTTEKQLIVDIAQGYDIVIMGADKWHQVNDAAY